MAAGTFSALRTWPRAGSCSCVWSMAAPGKERAQSELRGCGRGWRAQPSPALPRQGQPWDAPEDGAQLLLGVSLAPSSFLSLAMSRVGGMGWDGMGWDGMGQDLRSPQSCGPAEPLTILHCLKMVQFSRLLCWGNSRAFLFLTSEHFEGAEKFPRHASLSLRAPS